jgi:hypothetical protein
MLSKNSPHLVYLDDFIPFSQLCIGLRTFLPISSPLSMTSVHVNGSLFPNSLLDFHHVLPLYPTYRGHFSFTPCHYNGFMTWLYGGFTPSYNKILMTCPYLQLTVISSLFILSVFLSGRMVKLLLCSVSFPRHSPWLAKFHLSTRFLVSFFCCCMIPPIVKLVGPLDRVLIDCHSPVLSMLLH